MKTYNDLNGNSGIVAYEIADDTIDIEFASGGVYTYTRANLGEVNFGIMKALCEAGAGLNAFLNKVREDAKRNPNPFTTARQNVKVTLPTNEAVEVVAELLKNFDVTISVS